MLAVPALELRHPVAFLIEMESGDAPIHERSDRGAVGQGALSPVTMRSISADGGPKP